MRILGDAEAAWMIGDSFRADVMGAGTAGIPAILVRKHHPAAERCCEDIHAVAGVLEEEPRRHQGKR